MSIEFAWEGYLKGVLMVERSFRDVFEINFCVVGRKWREKKNKGKKRFSF